MKKIEAYECEICNSFYNTKKDGTICERDCNKKAILTPKLKDIEKITKKLCKDFDVFRGTLGDIYYEFYEYYDEGKLNKSVINKHMKRLNLSMETAVKSFIMINVLKTKMIDLKKDL